MSKWLLHGVILPTLGLMCVVISSEALANECKPIDVAAGAHSTVIADMILPEQVRCYALITEHGQDVSLQVLKDDNIRASLQVREKMLAHDDVSPDKQAHHILVEQRKRTVTPQLFRVLVTLTP